MKLKITPKTLIVSILHVSTNQSIPIKILVFIGKMFGFTDNTIRVTTARLLREGTLESDERGMYQLSEKTAPMNKFVDSWKLGEARLKLWDGSWICCLLPHDSISSGKKGPKALILPGLKEGLPGLWIRPNNLRISLTEFKQILVHLGVERKAEIFFAHQFDKNLIEQWQRFLWPVNDIIRSCNNICEKLRKSKSRLDTMPLENALVESFLLGSEAVYHLVTDPLLPEEIMGKAYRVALTEAMLEYDELGKNVWKQKFGSSVFDKHPPYLKLLSKNSLDLSFLTK